jgi:hypothetical protein
VAGQLPLRAADGFRMLSAHALVITCLALAAAALGGGTLAIAVHRGSNQNCIFTRKGTGDEGHPPP